MPAHMYTAYNAAAPTTAAMVPVTTGSVIKTMLQIATPSTRKLQVVSFGYCLSAVPSSGTVELLQTDVAATVTAHVAAGVQPLNPSAPASLVTLGTSATGYTATAEGTTTASRSFKTVIIPTSGSAAGSYITYQYQWVPDERPVVDISKFLRVRVTMGSAVNMTTWVTWLE